MSEAFTAVRRGMGSDHETTISRPVVYATASTREIKDKIGDALKKKAPG